MAKDKKETEKAKKDDEYFIAGDVVLPGKAPKNLDKKRPVVPYPKEIKRDDFDDDAPRNRPLKGK
jgi:hypothetical protein